MQQNIRNELVAAFPFLKESSAANRKDLFENAQFVTMPSWSIMVEEGNQCRGIVMVLDGSIRVYQLREDGREMTLYRVGSGQLCVLSVACMMGGVEYPVIAEIEQDDARIVMLPLVLFRRLFHTDPAWQRYVFSTMADRMVEMMTILSEVAFQRMDQRLASWILRQGAGEIQSTHEKIAADIGTAREVVSRVLKEMERQHMIELSRGRIRVTDADLLRELSDG